MPNHHVKDLSVMGEACVAAMCSALFESVTGKARHVFTTHCVRQNAARRVKRAYIERIPIQPENDRGS